MSTCDCKNQDNRANCCRLKAALAERDEARAALAAMMVQTAGIESKAVKDALLTELNKETP
jgi:hypothetical protein